MRCSDGVRLSPVAGDWRSHPLRDRESGEGPSSKSARAELGAAMAGESARASAGARRDVGTAAPDSGGAHGAYAVGPPAAAAARQLSAGRGGVAAGLIGAIAVTVISLVFIISYIGALHAPGPHSVPTGVVGGQAGTSAVSRTLDRAAPGSYDVASYPSATAARHAIIDRTIDVAAVFRPQGEQLLVATAISPSLANSTIKIFQRLAQTAGVPLTVQDVRPLPASDPDGLSKIYFMIALLAPSLTFGNMLITRISPRLHPLWHLAVIAVFAAIIAAVATALADPAIGALAGAPWALFGIGALFAFAVAVTNAAATRWAGGIGYVAVFLLFIPVGIASSGLTLGPNMITQWYADLGKALPPGASLTAINNAIYFNGNAVTIPLVVLAAWALAGTLALVMVAILNPPPLPRQHSQPAAEADSAAPETTPTGRHARAPS